MNWPVLHKYSCTKAEDRIVHDAQEAEYHIGRLKYWLKVWENERARAERYGYTTNPATHTDKLLFRAYPHVNAWNQVKRFRAKIRELCNEHHHFPQTVGDGMCKQCVLCGLTVPVDEHLLCNKVPYWNDDRGVKEFHTYRKPK